MGLLSCVPALAAEPPGRLATPALQKAAVNCQRLLAKVAAKMVPVKFNALDACANAAPP